MGQGPSSVSHESGWDGSTEDLGAAARPPEELQPGFPRGGLPTRLAAERDLLAVVAAAHVAAAGLDVAWAAIVWDSRGASAQWPLLALIVPHLFVLVGTLAAVYGALPAARWLRS